MKKGAWTEEEDTVLAEYVKRHGKGRWNMVERNTGLMRCGKSCRLRWYNHLRPNLKRGAISPEEERIVIELHAQIGNRWARIAMKLPGRSDNEIKNFWNTRAKRLERSGLPVYPKGVVPQYSPKRQRNQNHTTLSSSRNEIRLSNKNERSLPSLYPNPLNSELKLSPQFSMGPFSFFRNKNPNPLLPNSYPRNINGSNSNLVSCPYFLPFSSTLSSSTLNYSNSQTRFSSVYPFQSQSGHFNLNPNPPLSMPKSYNPKYVFANRERDHSSSESILRSQPSTCESSNGFYDAQFHFTARYVNNGLMEYTFRAPKTSFANDILSRKGKEICLWDGEFGSSSPNTTTGIQFCDPIEKMLPSDDDLSALLESFRTEGPSTDWYQAFFGNSSNKK